MLHCRILEVSSYLGERISKIYEIVDEGLDATTTFTNTVQHHVMLHCRILEVSSYLEVSSTSVSVFLKSTEIVDEGLDATTTFTNTVQHHVMLHCRILEVSSYLGERISKIYGDR
ncbi:hypothetical protein J6590_062630 [Homalodisca vitripennis]|nr:hypothetical protein J6590_062630 [Homalodisca vitripennis]